MLSFAETFILKVSFSHLHLLCISHEPGYLPFHLQFVLISVQSSFFQLCAGLKIGKKPPPFFFAYSGLGPNMTFHKLKYPLKNWKPAHLEVRSNWKDTYQFRSRLFRGWTSWSAGRTHATWEKYCQSSFWPQGSPFCFSGRQWRTPVGERGWGRRSANCVFGLTIFCGFLEYIKFVCYFFMHWFIWNIPNISHFVPNFIHVR